MSKEYAKAFYQSAAWRTVSKAVRVNKHYTCERCRAYGYIVHHVVHITPYNINNPDITLNANNLMLLCNECHNTIHHSGADRKSTAEGYNFTADGDIVPEHTPLA